MDLCDELKLVDKAKSNISAFNKLYDYYLPIILGYCINRLPRKEIAEDVTSEVFLAAVKNIKTFETSRNIRFGSWMLSVAHNKIVDYYRKSNKFVHRNVEEHEIFYEQEFDKELLHNEIKDKIKIVLSKLKPRYQEILSLKFYAELSNEEIAKTMKIKINNVSVLLHRAQKSFEKKYKQTYPKSEIFRT